MPNLLLCLLTSVHRHLSSHNRQNDHSQPLLFLHLHFCPHPHPLSIESPHPHYHSPLHFLLHPSQASTIHFPNFILLLISPASSTSQNKHQDQPHGQNQYRSRHPNKHHRRTLHVQTSNFAFARSTRSSHTSNSHFCLPPRPIISVLYYLHTKIMMHLLLPSVAFVLVLGM